MLTLCRPNSSFYIVVTIILLVYNFPSLPWLYRPQLTIVLNLLCYFYSAYVPLIWIKKSFPLSDFRCFSCIYNFFGSYILPFWGQKYRLIGLSWECILVFMRKNLKGSYQDP